MSENYDSVESALRRAPVPRPPSDLATSLRSQIDLPTSLPAKRDPVRGGISSFWRRRWPVLLPGVASLALAALVEVQHIELQDLTAKIAAVQTGSDAVTPARVQPLSDAVATTGERTELERLRIRVKELTRLLAGADALAAENAQLEAQVAAQKGTLPAEVKEVAEMRDRALRIQCVNNLKQLGLGVRIYAADHEENFPPSLLTLLNNEIANNFRALVCPADEAHTAATDASSVTAANCSYEFLAPGPGKFESEPHRVMIRCPIHGNVALCDGSVQQLTPERLQGLVQRDGKLYLENNAQVAPPRP